MTKYSNNITVRIRIANTHDMSCIAYSVASSRSNPQTQLNNLTTTIITEIQHYIYVYTYNIVKCNYDDLRRITLIILRIKKK